MGHDESHEKKSSSRNGKPLEEAPSRYGNVETGKPQGATDGVESTTEGRKNAENSLEISTVHHHGGSDSKTYHIRQAIELHAKSASASETPGHFSVHEIEKDRPENKPRRKNELFVKGRHQRKHTAKNVAAGYHIGNDLPKR